MEVIEKRKMEEEIVKCMNCGSDVSERVREYSERNYGIILCYQCQQKIKSGELEIREIQKYVKEKGVNRDNLLLK